MITAMIHCDSEDTPQGTAHLKTPASHRQAMEIVTDVSPSSLQAIDVVYGLAFAISKR
jgi:hypothetical protein